MSQSKTKLLLALCLLKISTHRLRAIVRPSQLTGVVKIE